MFERVLPHNAGRKSDREDFADGRRASERRRRSALMAGGPLATGGPGRDATHPYEATKMPKTGATARIRCARPAWAMARNRRCERAEEHLGGGTEC